MSKYLLATYSGPQTESAPAPTEEQMREFMQRVAAVEQEMDDQGVFVFGGALHGTDTATVVRPGESVMVDGPFVEAKEHIAGFYIIEAEDLDAALGWADKVAVAIGRSLEVRPFRATGRVRA